MCKVCFCCFVRWFRFDDKFRVERGFFACFNPVYIVYIHTHTHFLDLSAVCLFATTIHYIVRVHIEIVVYHMKYIRLL